MGSRLPIYVVLDTSSSMKGKKIAALKNAMKSLVSVLLDNPVAFATARLALIEFNTDVTLVYPPTSPHEVPMVSPTAGGTTNLGGALDLLRKSMARYTKPVSAEYGGDYRPMVFVLTDGQPTDVAGYRSEGWRSAATMYKAISKPKPALTVGIACGADADESVLGVFCDRVVKAKDATPETIEEIFKWISQSIVFASRSVSLRNSAASARDLQGLPHGWSYYEPREIP